MYRDYSVPRCTICMPDFFFIDSITRFRSSRQNLYNSLMLKTQRPNFHEFSTDGVVAMCSFNDNPRRAKI